jgi:hypothetical protein
VNVADCCFEASGDEQYGSLGAVLSLTKLSPVENFEGSRGDRDVNRQDRFALSHFVPSLPAQTMRETEDLGFVARIT